MVRFTASLWCALTFCCGSLNEILLWQNFCFESSCEIILSIVCDNLKNGVFGEDDCCTGILWNVWRHNNISLPRNRYKYHSITERKRDNRFVVWHPKFTYFSLFIIFVISIIIYDAIFRGVASNTQKGKCIHIVLQIAVKLYLHGFQEIISNLSVVRTHHFWKYVLHTHTCLMSCYASDS